MNISMIGAGRLGFPVGCAIAEFGYSVGFYDINKTLINHYKRGIITSFERRLPEVYAKVKDDLIYFDELEDAVAHGDILFIAVPTPHLPEQDGSIRWEEIKSDFDNSIVVDVVSKISNILESTTFPPRTVVVVSTMLPGSMDSQVLPVWNCDVIHKLIYSPSFIAMSTVVEDFVNPEFWLIGEHHIGDAKELVDFYQSINPVPIRVMSYSSAEAAKVFYNTFITMKLTFTNTIMEIADQIPGCDCDDIMDALQGATNRLVSPAYMRGGMVDGGGCHPRDNIALAWLSDKLSLPYNLFEWIMNTREKQVEYLANLVEQYRVDNQRVVILGKSFKPDTHITYGSPSLLLYNILEERGITATFYDVYSEPAIPPNMPSVYVMGVNMDDYKDFPFVAGSIIIDPWNMLDVDPIGCKVIRVGREDGR